MEKLRRERRANFGFCILIGRTNKKWAAALCPAAAGDKGGPVFNAVVDVDPYAAAYCLADNCAGCSENAGPSRLSHRAAAHGGAGPDPVEDAAGGLPDLRPGGLCRGPVAHHSGDHRRHFYLQSVFAHRRYGCDQADAVQCVGGPAGHHPADRLVLRRISGGNGGLWYRRGHSRRYAGRYGYGPGAVLPGVYAGQRLPHGLWLGGYSHHHAGQCDRAGCHPAGLYHRGGNGSLHDPDALPDGDCRRRWRQGPERGGGYHPGGRSVLCGA